MSQTGETEIISLGTISCFFLIYRILHMCQQQWYRKDSKEKHDVQVAARPLCQSMEISMDSQGILPAAKHMQIDILLKTMTFVCVTV